MEFVITSKELKRTRRWSDVDPTVSRQMSLVRSKNTKPEIAVRRILHRMGYRFRVHRKDLPGSPDIVFVGPRKILFVHGCFWHGHYCRTGNRIPKTRVEYWNAKIARNRQRDLSVRRRLRALGWQVLTVWECQLRRPAILTDRLCRFLAGT